MFDEFYTKLKDIVNSAFNLGETIPEPKVVRKVLKSLPERFHAKITAIKESKDIDRISLTELVVNLQSYELDLTRIDSSTCMELKAKSSDIDESSDDEGSKMKSYITRQFKKLMKNANAKGFNKTVSNPILHISRAKIEGRRMLRKAVSTLFSSDQSASDVKALDI